MAHFAAVAAGICNMSIVVTSTTSLESLSLSFLFIAVDIITDGKYTVLYRSKISVILLSKNQWPKARDGHWYPPLVFYNSSCYVSRAAAPECKEHNIKTILSIHALRD